MLNNEESRKGAMACLNAIRIIENIHRNPDPECTMRTFWRDQESSVAAMLQAAGVQDGFMAGFIASLAEYVCMVENSGVPNPYVWKPEAAMIEEEKAVHRASYEEETA